MSTKKAETKEIVFEEIEGHELLVPFSKVKGSDQARLLKQLQKLNVLGEGDLEFESLDFDILADLIDYVAEKFAVNVDKFNSFTSGPGGMQRALNLAIAFAGEVGKGAASSN